MSGNDGFIILIWVVIISFYTYSVFYAGEASGHKKGFAESEKFIIKLKDECQKSLPRDKYCTIIAVEAK